MGPKEKSRGRGFFLAMARKRRQSKEPRGKDALERAGFAKAKIEQRIAISIGKGYPGK